MSYFIYAYFKLLTIFKIETENAADGQTETWTDGHTTTAYTALE